MGRARVYDNLHSRLVGWLKVILPLLALGLLSSLFLFSRSINPEDAIPYADVDVADRLAQPRMVGVGFAGKTADGAAISLRAAEARPLEGAGADAAQAETVAAEVNFPDGGWLMLGARTLVHDGAAQSVVLSGGVSLASSSGYRASAEGFDLGLAQSGLTSHGPVQAEGPLGRIRAEQVVLSHQADKTYLLVFKGGVQVVYEPAKD